jgi:hypothetical protein
MLQNQNIRLGLFEEGEINIITRTGTNIIEIVTYLRALLCSVEDTALPL